MTLYCIVGLTPPRYNVRSTNNKLLSFQDSPAPQRVPTGFLLPTVRSKIVDDVPTVPTAPPTTAKTSTATTTTTTTTTTEKTTTTTTFELTPLSTEITTPRVYVSTSNFRPTLPNFGQEEDEEAQEVVETPSEPETVKPDVTVPRVPLVLAPETPTTSTTSTTTTTTTSSSSSFNIHNRLDELASNLDPWAHIQQAAQKVSHCLV